MRREALNHFSTPIKAGRTSLPHLKPPPLPALTHNQYPNNAYETLYTRQSLKKVTVEHVASEVSFVILNHMKEIPDISTAYSKTETSPKKGIEMLAESEASQLSTLLREKIGSMTKKASQKGRISILNTFRRRTHHIIVNDYYSKA